MEQSRLVLRPLNDTKAVVGRALKQTEVGRVIRKGSFAISKLSALKIRSTLNAYSRWIVQHGEKKIYLATIIRKKNAVSNWIKKYNSLDNDNSKVINEQDIIKEYIITYLRTYV